MNFWLSALVSLFLLACAAGLMISHHRTWRRVQRRQPEAEELDYRRRQFRRRTQTSAMLGLLAVAIFVVQLIPGPPLLVLISWGVVLLVLGWIGLLAVVDIWATKHYFGRLRQTFLVEEAKLQAELRRIRVAGGNGKSRGNGRGSKGEG